MIERLVATPRPVPGRLLPVLAGGAVILLALPVFVIAELSLRGWALGAILWLAAQALGVLLTRLPLGADNPAGVAGIGMMFRPVGVMVVAIAVAASNPEVGVAAALLYAVAYSLELALSLVTYFGKPAA